MIGEASGLGWRGRVGRRRVRAPVVEAIRRLVAESAGRRVAALGIGFLAALPAGADRGGFEALDAFLGARAREGLAFVVAVARGDEILFARGYGDADPRRGIANQSDTAFAIGSISKTFTAAAVYRLARRGDLSVDDTLAEHFAEAPGEKANITIDQLLNHTAGLERYHDRKGDFERMSREQALAAIFAAPLAAAPGEDYAYSNAGYTLLAILVEKISREPFQRHLRRHFFAPLDMRRTGFYGEAHLWHGRVARGKGRRSVGRNDPGEWRSIDLWALVGAGGIVSTAGDLIKWASARGALFPTPEPPADLGEELRFAHGWFLRRSSTAGLQVFHGGANDMGFLAMLRAYPEKDTILVLLSNTYRDKKPHIRDYLDEIEALLFAPS